MEEVVRVPPLYFFEQLIVESKVVLQIISESLA